MTTKNKKNYRLKVGNVIRTTPPGFKPPIKVQRSVGRPRTATNKIGLTETEQLFADLILENMLRSKPERKTKLQCWYIASKKPNTKKSTASVYASNMYHKPAVQQYIQDRKKAAANRVEIKTGEVLTGLLRIANFDERKLFDSKGRPIPVHKLPDDIALSIAGTEFTRVSTRTPTGRRRVLYYTKKFRTESRKAAWELIGQHLNMWDSNQTEQTAEEFIQDMRSFADSAAAMVPGGEI